MINTTSRRSPAFLRHSTARRLFNAPPLVLLPLALGCFILLNSSLTAQRVESVKDKIINMRGVEFKKDLGRSVDGNWVYQVTMENKTNEAMVVELALEFSNDEISESFEENYHLEPGETKVGSFTSKVRGTKENAIVTVNFSKRLVRPAREVAEEARLRDEKSKRDQAQKAAADFARKKKAGEDWQKQMAELAAASRRAASNKSGAPAEPVKFDAQLVKLLLLEMEGQKPKPDLTPFSKPAVNQHWGLMIDAGLVDGAAIKSDDGTVNSVMLKRLTKEGRDFLVAAKVESTWKRVTQKAAEEGDAMTISRLRQLVTDASGAPVK